MSKQDIYNKETLPSEVIGIVGGFGSYATLDFFERLLNSFPAEKEWERPRILIDNYCTLPSRVRGILYHENEDEIIEGLTNSIRNLMMSGATKIIITCNTAHYYLKDVYLNLPESNEIIVNIIEELALELNENNIKEVSLIATEGTILSKIYHDAFKKYNIKINAPSEEDYYKMRDLIEIVKQNKKITSSIKNDFIKLITEQKDNSVILGCTEFPVLFKYVKEDIKKENITIYDPLETAILKIKNQK